MTHHLRTCLQTAKWLQQIKEPFSGAQMEEEKETEPVPAKQVYKNG